MKNLKKLDKENLKAVLGGGFTCLGNLYLIEANGYYACCTKPDVDPCNSSAMCLTPVGMCDTGIPA
ncbi:hypothetical protein HNP24_004287 [Chryseobacterium sediminis]|uniref:Bacteriocin n=1 Tax=Chryseobacterium sediminis TaxID=1679494 RepID=A0ABR6Q5N2_9FLAO|nr:hypothetical protein [Chryseobacterium sediminis]MBB6333263.1 hypothetical protein [Chryseobacterium sediminis]